MDHLSLPKNPVIRSLPVPYLYDELYDGGPFTEYPERTGWNVTVEYWPETLTRHGKEVTDHAQIASLLQTWLYFGVLYEITGGPIDPKAFSIPDSSQDMNLFCSNSLTDTVGKWFNASKPTEPGVDSRSLNSQCAFETSYSHWLHVLDLAESTWTRIVDRYHNEMTDVLSLVLVSLAALGDYFAQACADVALERDIEDGTPSTSWILSEEVCRSLLGNMVGWCPNRLHSIINIQGCTIGVLWYVANLKPPEVHDLHRSCARERCIAILIDQRDYIVRHVHAACKCDSISRLTSDMARIVRQGSIALFTMQTQGEQLTLSVQNAKRTYRYVAISHVWADGHGNPKANSLPICVLQKLQQNVDALGISSSRVALTPIWMDTVCLPRFPLELRREALQRLSDVFSKASGVLVLDSYLQTHDLRNISPMEIVARIAISGWTTRLWTYSEGRLSRRIWFQFRDQAVDLYHLINDKWFEELGPRLPSSPSTVVAYGTMTLHSATNRLEGGQTSTRRLEIGQMKVALISRQTSWASDEALCLGTLLRQDLSRILEAKDQDKMAAFWQQIDSVPMHMIFTKCLPKVEKLGCRWAPATLLSGANTELATLTSANLIESTCSLSNARTSVCNFQ